MKNILSFLLVLFAFTANAQIQEYVIEASDSLITRGVLQVGNDKFKATTQVSSDDTTLVSLDYLTNLLDNAEYADSLAFHSGTGYLVYYREGVALDSTSLDNRYVPYTGANTTVNLGSQNLTTTGTVTGGNLNIANWNTAFGWGSHSGLYINKNTGLQTDASKTSWTSPGIELYTHTTGSTNYPNALGLSVEFSSGNGASGSSYGRDFTIDRAFNTSEWYLRGYNTIGQTTGFNRIWHSGNFISGTNYQAPLINPVTGTGTINYIPKFTGLSTIGNSLIYENGTSVAIGSTSPLKLLHLEQTVSGDITYPLILRSNNSTINTSTGIMFAPSIANATRYSSIIGYQEDGNNNIGLKFITGSGATITPKMTIRPNGNIGINTIIATQRLDVDGNARFRAIGTTATSTVLGVTTDGTLTTNVSITGGATWKGGWNASTNTPTLSDATGTNGWWYKVTVAGTQNLGSGSQTYAVGDDVIHNGTIWQKFNAMISEADPVFVASDVYNWTKTDSTNWSTAYSWGNHANAGYLTTEIDGSVTNELQNLSLGTTTTTTQPIGISGGTGITLPAATTSLAGLMTSADKTNLNTVVGWGNHAGLYSLLAHTHNTLRITDVRTLPLNTTNSISYHLSPEEYSDRDISTFFGYISGAGSGWRSGINLKGWITGYASWQLIGNASTTTDDDLYFRTGIGTTWNTPRKIFHEGNFTDNSTNWNAAYNDKINSAAFSGTTTKTLTLTQQDGGTVTANFTDLVDDADASATNEGSLTVAAGSATTSVINSNTSGSTGVTIEASTGLSISEAGNTITLTNSAPDQTVTLTQGGATTITGTYPNFTISSTDNNTTYSAGTGISASGTTFNLGLEELTTGAPSLNTHWIPWVNSANNLHYRVGLLDLQEIAGWDAGKLQNVPISSTAPTTDYVLKYNGSQWAPAVDATGASYWTQASGALYPATITDEVRIGSVTDLGAQKLQVDASSVFRLRNVNTSQPIDFITTGTGTQPYFRFEHDGSGGLRLASYDGSSSWNEVFKVTASSRTPQFPAGLILGTSFSTSTAGSIRWNGTNFQGYNGSTWVNLDTQGGTGGMTDPMTTRGDIIYRNSSNVTARLASGNSGQLLYSNGTDIYWRSPIKSDIGLGNVENTALSTWTGSTNLSTVGSITQGNWNADPISVTKGGTGKTSYTAYALLAGGTTSTGTLQQVSGVGTAGQVLTSNGAGALPSWQANSAGGWVDNGTDVVLSNTSDNVAIGASSAGTGNKLLVNGNIYTSSLFVSSYITFNQLSGYLGSSGNPWLYTMASDDGLIYQKGSSFDNYRYHLTSKIQPVTSSTATISYSTGDLAQDTLTANTTYNITYIPDGAEGEIFVRQDGTGGWTLTLNMYPLSTSSTALTKVTAGATTAIKTTANKHTLIRYRRWGTKVTLEYLQEP